MTISGETTATLSANDGTQIFYRSYAAETEKARMVISHGLGEHSGRYENVVAPLLAAGISIWAPDHRGHGKSGGRRGHAVRFGQYLADLHQVFGLMRTDLPAGRKCFLLGHSLGGLIAARYAQQYAAGIDALILSSPALGMVVAVPAAKQRLAKLTSAIYPALSMKNELDATKLSHDQKVVQAYIDDPLVHDRVSARWFTEFLTAMQAAHGDAGQIQVPILMQVAADDHLVSAPAAQKFFDQLTTADKTFRRYEGLYHEIYNAPADQRKTVLNDLIGWVVDRIQK